MVFADLSVVLFSGEIMLFLGEIIMENIQHSD